MTLNLNIIMVIQIFIKIFVGRRDGILLSQYACHNYTKINVLHPLKHIICA